MTLIDSQKRMDLFSDVLIGLVRIGKGLRQYCNIFPNLRMPGLDVSPRLLISDIRSKEDTIYLKGRLRPCWSAPRLRAGSRHSLQDLLSCGISAPNGLVACNLVWSVNRLVLLDFAVIQQSRVRGTPAFPPDYGTYYLHPTR